jgi:DNA-binding CsgD family transcriptional regulator
MTKAERDKRIKELRRKGIPPKAIAVRMGLSVFTVYEILRGER